MGIPIAKVGLIGAIASLASAVLLTKAKPSGGFARATAFGALSGAAFAIGVQPLAWIGAGAVCPVCLGIVICAVVFAVLATSIAIKMKKDVLLAVLFAVCVGGILGYVSYLAGSRIHEQDEVALAGFGGKVEDLSNIRLTKAKGGLPGFDSWLVLVERPGCPYCRALTVDVIANQSFLDACRAAGVRQLERCDEKEAREKNWPVRNVPTLLLFRRGELVGSLEGYLPDLDPYLELLDKARAR
jgi:thioredoxin-related protein